MRIITTGELPLSTIAREFAGAAHGASVTLVLVDAPPGAGPRLHRHPYDEVILVQDGEATFRTDQADDVARAGDIVVVPAGEAHAFTNTGAARLRQVDIHASPGFETEWLEDDAPTPQGAPADRRSGSLSRSRAIAKIPAQDLDRARDFYRDKLGLEPIEERENGLRYCCAAGEFHVFLSSGEPSGASTQLGFEVEDLDATMAELRGRGVVFDDFDVPGLDVVDGVVHVGDNYPSRGSGERGAFFRDSEGNVLALGQPTG